MNQIPARTTARNPARNMEQMAARIPAKNMEQIPATIPGRNLVHILLIIIFLL